MNSQSCELFYFSLALVDLVSDIPPQPRRDSADCPPARWRSVWATNATDRRHRTDAPFRFYAQTLLGNLDYAFNRDLKISLLPGVSFFEVNARNPYEIAPSPSIDIRLLNVNNMNRMTGLKFFILSRVSEHSHMNVVRTGDLPLHSVNMALRRGCGFCTSPGDRLRLEPEAVFWDVLYSSSLDECLDSAESARSIRRRTFSRVKLGVEVDLSPTMSAIGSLEFSFESSEMLYR